MADFDAGSIEGRLDLDTDPFVRGLREAKAQAAEFERTSSVTTNAGVDVNDGDSEAKITALEARLKRLDAERAEPKVDVDTSRANAALTAMERHIDRVGGAYKAGSNPLSGGGGGHGLMYLIGLAAALAPALGPATAAVGLFGSAAIAAFGGAAVSIGLWGAVAKGVFSQIEKANKAGTTLSGPMGKLQASLKSLSKAWGDLQNKAAPGIAAALGPAMHTLSTVLPKLLPLINAVSKGIGGALLPLQHLLTGGQFERFIKLLSSNAITDLPQVGHILANILHGLMGLFTALNPVIQVALPVVVKMTHEFSKWARTGAAEFVQNIFDKVRVWGPLTLHMLGAVLGGVAHVAAGMAPLVGPALHFLTGLGNALKIINLAPLAKGVGDVLDKLSPFLNVIGQLVNILLPPLGTLLSTLADSFIGPLGDSLSTVLNPAFDALSGLLDRLAKPLGLFVASIADLVNPTGVGLAATLMQNLAKPVGDILVPLINLATAIEGVVDNFLKAVAPDAIPVLTGLMQGLADIVGPLADGLAAFLNYGPVGPILLGIALGIKATILAVKGYQAVAAFVGIIRTIMELSAAEGIMAGIAAVSPALAGGLTAIGIAFDFMTGPIGLTILGIAALVAGFIYAYKHVGWFHDAVDGLFKIMSDVGDWINGVLIGIFHALGDAIHWVKHHTEVLWLLLGPFGAAILGVIEIIKHWHKIVSIVKDAWNAVIGWLKGLPHRILSIFDGAGDWLNEKGRAIIRGLWNGIKDLWSSVTGWLGGIGDKINHAVGDLGHFLYSKGVSLIQGFWNGISDRFESLWSDFGGKIHKLTSWLPGSPAKIGPLSGRGWTLYRGRAMMQGFAEGIDAGAADVNASAARAMAGVSNTLKAGPTAITGTANLSLSGGVSASDLQAQAQAESLARLTDVLDNLSDDLRSASKEERDAMAETVTKAFVAASTASTQKVITAVKKQ